MYTCISIFIFAFEWELSESSEPEPLGRPQTPLFHALTPLGPQQGLPQPPQTPLFHARAPLEAPQTLLFAVLEPLDIRKPKETEVRGGQSDPRGLARS